MSVLNPTIGLAGLLRRLGSMVYDWLVLAGVLMVAAFPVVMLARDALPHSPWRTLFQGYLLLVAVIYFSGFWVHGGQTPGMRAWQLKLTTHTGQDISWKQALLRLLAAVLSSLPAGLGWLWILVDRQGLAWHDRISGTRLSGRLSDSGTSKSPSDPVRKK